MKIYEVYMILVLGSEKSVTWISRSRTKGAHMEWVEASWTFASLGWRWGVYRLRPHTQCFGFWAKRKVRKRLFFLVIFYRLIFTYWYKFWLCIYHLWIYMLYLIYVWFTCLVCMYCNTYMHVIYIYLYMYICVHIYIHLLYIVNLYVCKPLAHL